MDTKLLLAILSSSLLAAILTKSVDIYTLKLGYKRDFYKKVIDERLKTYLKLNEVLNLSVGQIVDFPVGYNIIFNDREIFYKFQNGLLEVANARIWLSVEAASVVVQIVELMANESTTAKLSIRSTDLEFQAFGKVQTNKFNELTNQLEDILLTDLQHLYDVKKFLSKSTTVLPKT